MTLENHQIVKSESALEDFLNRFSLIDKSHKYPRDLSVGERQRVALAAITVHDPEIILLDEPTRGLDYVVKEKLDGILKNWRNIGKSILLATHDVEFAAGLADRVVILDHGRIIFCGPPKVAFSEYQIFQTQTARIFPNQRWISPKDIPPEMIRSP
jgi:energy-coupling factor transport system ATP-binding protein